MAERLNEAQIKRIISDVEKVITEKIGEVDSLTAPMSLARGINISELAKAINERGLELLLLDTFRRGLLVATGEAPATLVLPSEQVSFRIQPEERNYGV